MGIRIDDLRRASADVNINVPLVAGRRELRFEGGTFRVGVTRGTVGPAVWTFAPSERGRTIIAVIERIGMTFEIRFLETIHGSTSPPSFEGVPVFHLCTVELAPHRDLRDACVKAWCPATIQA